MAQTHTTTAVITGFYNGLGRHVTFALIENGIHVIGLGRSAEKANAFSEELRKKYPDAGLDFIACDLRNQEQIHEASRLIHKSYNHIDILINNAGVVNKQKHVTPEGLEETFAVNTLAPFLLSRLLLDRLLNAAYPRIVNTASEVYKQGKIDLQHFYGEGKFSLMGSYANSKLALMLWTYEMAERLKHKSISFRLIHPGFVPATGIFRRIPLWMKPLMGLMRMLPMARNETQAARPIIEAALSYKNQEEKVVYVNEAAPETPKFRLMESNKENELWNFLEEHSGLPAFEDTLEKW